jgi:hypothetical protein
LKEAQVAAGAFVGADLDRGLGLGHVPRDAMIVAIAMMIGTEAVAAMTTNDVSVGPREKNHQVFSFVE